MEGGERGRNKMYSLQPSKSPGADVWPHQGDTGPYHYKRRAEEIIEGYQESFGSWEQRQSVYRIKGVHTLRTKKGKLKEKEQRRS